ncbi:MAG TPA: orotidine 5'-phosphate decarboxylase [Thermoflexales bacterium]|nr:orotidine 5'-phosphate decarboxylase [Thermoflexales bacterium]
MDDGRYAAFNRPSSMVYRPPAMLLQVALDTFTLPEAVAFAKRIAPFVDVVEAGTALIKREGMAAVRALREAIGPDKILLADMKTFDAGRYEAELALDAGADFITVLGCAGDATIHAVIAAAHARGKCVVADVVGVEDKVRRAGELTAFGADVLGIHADEDVTPRPLPHPLLRQLAGISHAPLSIAGGVTKENIAELRPYAPRVIVIGSTLTKAAHPETVAKNLRAAA